MFISLIILSFSMGIVQKRPARTSSRQALFEMTLTPKSLCTSSFMVFMLSSSNIILKASILSPHMDSAVSKSVLVPEEGSLKISRCCFKRDIGISGIDEMGFEDEAAKTRWSVSKSMELHDGSDMLPSIMAKSTSYSLSLV